MVLALTLNLTHSNLQQSVDRIGSTKHLPLAPPRRRGRLPPQIGSRACAWPGRRRWPGPPGASPGLAGASLPREEARPAWRGMPQPRPTTSPQLDGRMRGRRQPERGESGTCPSAPGFAHCSSPGQVRPAVALPSRGRRPNRRALRALPRPPGHRAGRGQLPRPPQRQLRAPPVHRRRSARAPVALPLTFPPRRPGPLQPGLLAHKQWTRKRGSTPPRIRCPAPGTRPAAAVARSPPDRHTRRRALVAGQARARLHVRRLSTAMQSPLPARRTAFSSHSHSQHVRNRLHFSP
eukprot:scaffold14853_cov137-Isochrysis_galbana.AAC.3